MSDSRELKKIISKENKVLKGSAFLTDDINKKHLDFQVSAFIRKHPKSTPVRLTEVSFKPGSDIIEESQKLAFAVRLVEEGYSVVIIDSEHVINNVKKKYGDKFSYERTNS